MNFRPILVLAIVLQLVFSCKKEKVDTYSDYYSDNPMVHQEGNIIVNENGDQLYLKGTIPLGWLQWEGTIWNSGLLAEKKMAQKVTELVGEEEFEAFRDSVYVNFITEADIEEMAGMGFNCVRVAFNHTILEDDDNLYVYKESGWQYLDNVIEWGETHGVYVMLDMHSAPGGQSTLLVSDPDDTKLWQSDENINRTVELWRAIANRYKDETIVAGYDLLNEPDMPKKKLISIYEKIITAVRSVDPYHMLFIEGNDYAVKFKKFKAPFSQNMVWSFHTYDLLNSGNYEDHFEEVVKVAEDTKTPIMNGEFGANTTSWISDVLSMYGSGNFPVSGWIYWPWKRIPADDPEQYAHLYYFNPGSNWQKVSDYISGISSAPTTEEIQLGLSEFIEACKLENCQLNTSTQSVLN